ncbi:MAG: putative NADPH-dependent reductase [Candidatus Saccharibacteria bacterium]|nr:putative NADPH-dependent reductase [Candidatus Saccharibacteria bacterium]
MSRQWLNIKFHHKEKICYTKYSNNEQGESMTKIAVLAGSLRADSMNKQLAKIIEGFVSSDVKFIHLDISEVPLFNQDLEADVPASVKKLKADIDSVDGVLLITPEYNRGMPGVIKNAIDWASRPYGDNSFDRKPVAITGSTGSPWGTVGAQQQLRVVMSYLNAHIMGQPELYIGAFNPVLNAEGVMEDHIKERLTGFVTALEAHVALFKK